MDSNTSGEELVVKTRKPYTITKQRERWTEEEHNRFLEALRLYGRAWQKIEEHIGTKTAVQIRSHAQKFFTKLEKEAQAKGITVAEALDMEIPPPRPKRKPSNPYPRKPGNGVPPSQSSLKEGKHFPSTSYCKQSQDSEKEPLPEKPSGDGKLSNSKENCSEVLTLPQRAGCSSMSSVNKSSTTTRVALWNSCTFREFIPSPKQTNQDSGGGRSSDMGNHDKEVQDSDKGGINGTLQTDDTQGSNNFPRHVPVHILDGNFRTSISLPDSTIPQMREFQANSPSFPNAAVSATIEHHTNTARVFPAFHPAFTPTCRTPDDYRSFLHISSAFSNLIVSTLLQNPPAHAAASFAASFWPYFNPDASTDSPRQMSSPPSTAAIAAATVAAATAWWASHGFLPMCPHFQATFTGPITSNVPLTVHGEVPLSRNDEKKTACENLNQLGREQSEALKVQNSESKLQAQPISDTEEATKIMLNAASKRGDRNEVVPAAPETQQSNKGKNRKQVERSSCGSNTSSEAETDELEKNLENNEEVKGTDTNRPGVKLSNRRSRSRDNLTDSWKQVSEEGRMAFQALFSRTVLPQSFSPPQDMSETNNQTDCKGDRNLETGQKKKDKSELNSSCKAVASPSDDRGMKETSENTGSTDENNDLEGLLTSGLGSSKHKSRRTGFKPYKRCAVEAKENGVVKGSSQSEERVTKRIRLEGEAST